MVSSVRKLVRGAVFAALLSTASLFFRVSSGIVPFSLVPLVIVLGGLLLETDEAFAGTGLYLLIGLAGFPVFATPPFGGPLYVLQPTFGFLLGFLVAAPFLSFVLARSGRLSFFKVWFWSSVAIGVLYLPGLLYLWLILNFVLGIEAGLARVFSIGFWPFIGPDLLKALVAGLFAWRIRHLQWVKGVDSFTRPNPKTLEH